MIYKMGCSSMFEQPIFILCMNKYYLKSNLASRLTDILIALSIN